MKRLRNLQKLHNAKEVMEALLNGKRVVHTGYGIIDMPCGGLEDDGEMWLYLNDRGFISEEDGAGVKSHRLAPLAFRDEKTEWYMVIK